MLATQAHKNTFHDIYMLSYHTYTVQAVIFEGLNSRGLGSYDSFVLWHIVQLIKHYVYKSDMKSTKI